MSNFRINPNERTKRINISLTPSVIDKLDEMTVMGHRSEFIRDAVESAYSKYADDADLLRWYQSCPNDIMFTQNPAKLARVKKLLGEC